MNSSEPTIERDDWLRQTAGLRRLAASLLGDEHEAEDLVQETWLRASGGAARQPRWLRSVLRNLVRDRLRARGQRRQSERDAARPERLPSESEIVANLEVVQRVAAEVARLEEPYRTAIHLRYFEGRTPEEIARAAGVPLETARTRLRRGLALLRERMDRAHGGERGAWAVALAPLAARVGTATGVTAGASLAATGVLMSTKLVLASAAALAVVAGLFFVLRSPHAAGLRAAHEPIAAAAPDPTGDVELRARVAGALAATREPVGVEPASPVAAAATTLEVHGTVVIEDEQGAEHASESGTLTIAHFHDRKSTAFAEVTVNQGAWSLALTADELFVVAKLVTGGREALLPEFRALAPGPGPIVVRGKWLSRGWLRVVDAATKAELSGIEIRCADGWRANPNWTHPGDDERVKTVVTDGTSPVELPERNHYTPYWVHAPGHAWARVDFDHKKGGQRTVELSPLPSSVVVTIAGARLPENARVRLHPQSDVMEEGGYRFKLPERREDYMAAVSVRAAPGGPTRIDDLQAGRFVAAIETGQYEETLRYGEAPVEVEPGATAFVTVALDPALLDVPRTHLFGTIETPDGLERDACELWIERMGGGEKPFSQRLSEMTFPRGDEQHLLFDAGLVRTGDYIVKVRGIELRALVHATGPGETRVTLVIPPLVTVTVEVFDANTGQKVEPERVDWHGAKLEGVSSFELVKLPPDPHTGQYRFVAPRGEVEVSCRAKGYRDAEQELELTGSAQTCKLALERATGLRLLLREDGAVVQETLQETQDFWMKMRIARVDGAEFEQRWGYSTAAENTRFLGAPGRYRLVFAPLEGFEPIAPLTVDVADGEMLAVPIELQRER